MANKLCPGCKVNNAEYLKRARRWLCRPCALEIGFLVRCSGEAHSNPFIDNCGVCMPRWGVHEVANVADILFQLDEQHSDARGDCAYILKRQPSIEAVMNGVKIHAEAYDRLYGQLARRIALDGLNFIERDGIRWARIPRVDAPGFAFVRLGVQS